MKISSFLFGNFYHERPKNRSLIIAEPTIPREIIQKITDGFSFHQLQNCSLVSKNWRIYFPASLFQQQRLALFEKVFSPLKWNANKNSKQIVKKEEFLTACRHFPLDLDRMVCPLDPTKNVLDTHHFFYIPEIFKAFPLKFEKILRSFYNKDPNVYPLDYYYFRSNSDCHVKNSGWFAILKKPLTKIPEKQTFTEFAEKFRKPYRVCQGFELLLYQVMNQNLENPNHFPLFFGFYKAIQKPGQMIFLLEKCHDQNIYVVSGIELPDDETYHFFVMIELDFFRNSILPEK